MMEIFNRQSLAAYAATGFDANFFMRCMKKQLAEQVGKQGDEGGADQGHTAAGHELLHALALCAGVIVAVTFQQVDSAPDAETCAKRDHEGLENTDSALKKCHIRSSSRTLRLLTYARIKCWVFCPDSRNRLLSDLLS